MLSLAPETRTSKEHTFESDVFSVAAFIWEVYALGLNSSDCVYTAVSESSGNGQEYLPRPDICPRDTYLLLRSCWTLCKTERPPIETLEQHLDQALKMIE
ncbi:Fibroblast growth factor receptor 1-A [Holothuria leucospilota]|uniref:Fibroblast growth factor receptor 1-A n=1 Tax=Holothuria leucospilota TaxID=206669 RepID=A0A9Q1BXM2_HOLLE|nr:Fibroblast growth factor receptor 1-A [Holothuria leucospilota]